MNLKMIVTCVLMALLLIFSGVVFAQDGVGNDTSDDIVIDPDAVEEGIDAAAEGVVGVTETVTEVTVTSVNTWINRLLTLPTNPVIQILFVVGGVALLLAGWRIYDAIILLAGALVGAAVLSGFAIESSLIIQVAAILIGGLIGAAIAALLYPVAVFFIGAYVGIALLTGLATAMGYASVSSILIIVAAILGGIILLALAGELLIVLSAVVGAQMIVLALGLSGVWTIILAVVGVAVQFYLAHRSGFEIRRRTRRTAFWRRRTA